MQKIESSVSLRKMHGLFGFPTGLVHLQATAVVWQGAEGFGADRDAGFPDGRATWCDSRYRGLRSPVVQFDMNASHAS